MPKHRSKSERLYPPPPLSGHLGQSIRLSKHLVFHLSIQASFLWVTVRYGMGTLDWSHPNLIFKMHLK